MIAKYYQLIKPGIIRGNAITAAAGFFLASKGNIDWGLLLALLTGVSLVMASGCVANNYIDRDIDAKMQRTKSRALARNTIAGHHAIIYSIILAIAGFGVLAAFTNLLTVLVGVVGFVDYVVLYGWSKRKSVHGTLVGTIAGATPPVAGYVAVTNRLDAVACLLFLILVLWQMPHFYAIAIRRMDEYKAAKLPMMPIVKGVKSTKIQMIIYAAGFTAAIALLSLLDYVGMVYLVVMLVISWIWLKLIASGFSAPNNQLWAKQVFLFSLLVLLAFSFMISIDTYLKQ